MTTTNKTQADSVTCPHRDSRGIHYPNCPIPECIDGVLCCEVHLVKDRQPAVTFDAGAGLRLCQACADEAAGLERERGAA